MAQESGQDNRPNVVERAVGRMMGGSTATVDRPNEIVIGQEYGRTPYSEEPEKWYEGTRGKRRSLDASEYHAVSRGYLREWVCMGQCNLYIQVLENPMLRQSMEIYRRDVCEPNVAEMKELLEAGGYELPAPYNAETEARSVDELGSVETDAIDDRMILVGHIFSVEAFMNRWNEGGPPLPPGRRPGCVPPQLPPREPRRDRDGGEDAVHRARARDPGLRTTGMRDSERPTPTRRPLRTYTVDGRQLGLFGVAAAREGRYAHFNLRDLESGRLLNWRHPLWTVPDESEVAELLAAEASGQASSRGRRP